MNTLWFPDRKPIVPKEFVSDSFQLDFDKQAELYVGLSLVSTQLTTGRFKGRFFSAHLDNISIHLTCGNQLMENQILVSPNDFAFCILFEGALPSINFGIPESRGWVYVLPPGGEAVAVCPPDRIILVVTVNRDALIHNDGLVAEASEWLSNVDIRGVCIDSMDLTTHLRSHIMSALESAGRAKSPEALSVIDQATIFTIAYELTMEWLKQGTFSTFQRTVAFERFQNARQLLLDELCKTKENSLQSLNGLGSRRSIELAFSKHVFMGPLAYCRVVRLHNVRRKLTKRKRYNQSIGDIASEEGFWDWSRFSFYYRKQFGELPSETRCRLRT